MGGNLSLVLRIPGHDIDAKPTHEMNDTPGSRWRPRSCRHTRGWTGARDWASIRTEFRGPDNERGPENRKLPLAELRGSQTSEFPQCHLVLGHGGKDLVQIDGGVHVSENIAEAHPPLQGQ